MAIQGYIHDGYTRSAFVKEKKLLYPAIRFRYRPVLAADRLVISRAIRDSKNPREEQTLAASAVKGHLVEWDLKDHEGMAVPLEVASILRVQPALFDRLYEIVMGFDGGDDDPEAQDHEPEQRLVRLLDAALSGRDPEGEFDAKNSPAG